MAYKLCKNLDDWTKECKKSYAVRRSNYTPYTAYRKDTCATPNHFYQHMSDTYTMFRKNTKFRFVV